MWVLARFSKWRVCTPGYRSHLSDFLGNFTVYVKGYFPRERFLRTNVRSYTPALACCARQAAADILRLRPCRRPPPPEIVASLLAASWLAAA